MWFARHGPPMSCPHRPTSVRRWRGGSCNCWGRRACAAKRYAPASCAHAALACTVRGRHTYAARATCRRGPCCPAHRCTRRTRHLPSQISWAVACSCRAARRTLTENDKKPYLAAAIFRHVALVHTRPLPRTSTQVIEAEAMAEGGVSDLLLSNEVRCARGWGLSIPASPN